MYISLYPHYIFHEVVKITTIFGREKHLLNQETARTLREIYPNHIPLEVAAQFLAVSPRRLSKLIAEGRQPYASIGANIGSTQNYVRVYTERLIAYLNGTLPIEK